MLFCNSSERHAEGTGVNLYEIFLCKEHEKLGEARFLKGFCVISMTIEGGNFEKRFFRKIHEQGDFSCNRIMQCTRYFLI